MRVSVGDRFVSMWDEVDHDEDGIERITPAGSVWRIDGIGERGTISAFCDATGGWIFPGAETLGTDFDRCTDCRPYTVRWEINIDAASPRAAAEEALRIQRDPGSIATQFYVTDDGTSRGVSIDFYEEGEDAWPEDYRQQAQREGWDLFSIDDRVVIQREDDSPLICDDEVILHVVSRAASGSQLHIKGV